MVEKFSPNHLLICCSNNRLRVIKNIIVYYNLPVIQRQTHSRAACVSYPHTGAGGAGKKTGKARLARVQDGEAQAECRRGHARPRASAKQSRAAAAGSRNPRGLRREQVTNCKLRLNATASFAEVFIV